MEEVVDNASGEEWEDFTQRSDLERLAGAIEQASLRALVKEESKSASGGDEEDYYEDVEEVGGCGSQLHDRTYSVAVIRCGSHADEVSDMFGITAPFMLVVRPISWTGRILKVEEVTIVLGACTLALSSIQRCERRDGGRWGAPLPILIPVHASSRNAWVGISQDQQYQLVTRYQSDTIFASFADDLGKRGYQLEGLRRIWYNRLEVSIPNFALQTTVVTKVGVVSTFSVNCTRNNVGMRAGTLWKATSEDVDSEDEMYSDEDTVTESPSAAESEQSRDTSSPSGAGKLSQRKTMVCNQLLSGPWERWLYVEDPFRAIDLFVSWNWKAETVADHSPPWIESSLYEEKDSVWSIKPEARRGNDTPNRNMTFTRLLRAFASEQDDVSIDGYMDRLAANGEGGSANWRRLPLESKIDQVITDIFHSSFAHQTGTPMNLKRRLQDLHGAPIGGLLSRLSLHALVFSHARAVAMLWTHFVRVLEGHHRKKSRIPHIPLSERPQLHSCVLQQKLVMLQESIRREEETSGTFSRKGSIKKRGGGVQGVLGAVEGVTLESDPDTTVNEPVTQESPWETIEELNQRTAALELVHRANEDERALQSFEMMNFQAKSLRSDMSAFKAANPGAELVDFVRWFSPRDWDADSGLSSRMRREGNVWETIWWDAEPCPAALQKPLQDWEAEGMKAVHYLETITPIDLMKQLLAIATGTVIELLAGSRVASCKPVADVLYRAADVTASLSMDKSDCWDAESDSFQVILNHIEAAERAVLEAESVLLKLEAVGVPHLLEQIMSNGEALVSGEADRSALLWACTGVAEMELPNYASFCSPKQTVYTLETTVSKHVHRMWAASSSGGLSVATAIADAFVGTPPL